MYANPDRTGTLVVMLVFKAAFCAGLGFGCWWLWESVHPALALAVLAYFTMDFSDA